MTKKHTEAEKERGISLLTSVRIVANVLYALIIFQIFLILPRPDDPELAYHTLEQIYSDNLMSLLVIAVGLILTIIYWTQFNLLIGNIKRSTPVHAVLSLLQVFFLMIYLYFVRFDLEFDGLKIALQMESIFLALAGFLGAYNWRYARKNGLTSDNITDKEELDIFYKVLPEPIASVITLPFAVFGPGIWTLAFLSIIPVMWILKMVRKKHETIESKIAE